MPGKEMKKALNICFPNDEIIDYWKYQQVFDAKVKKGEINPSMRIQYNSTDGKLLYMISRTFYHAMTIRERLEITMNADNLFKPKVPSRKYILYLYICYQLIPIYGEEEFETELGFKPLSHSVYAKYKMKRILLQNVSSMHIVLNPIHQQPFIEFFLKPGTIDINWERTAGTFTVTAYSYKLENLEWPYVNYCINYLMIGFKDKRDAINTCIHEKTIAKFGKTSRFKVFDNETAVNYPMLDRSMKSQNESVQFSVQCKKIYHQTDCKFETSFTKTIAMEGHSEDFYFFQSMGEDPSYEIQSQPKIENVDFITYILGTLGTWFGFTFVLLNPVNYFLQSSNVKKLISERKDKVNYSIQNDMKVILTRFSQHDIERKINIEKMRDLTKKYRKIQKQLN